MEEKHVIITPEYVDLIRQFAAIRPRETFVYVPLVYRKMDDTLKPRFTLRPISGEDALQFSDSMRGVVSVVEGKAIVNVKRGGYTIAVVRAGLLGWENYYDLDGTAVPYEPKAFEALPLALLEELCDAILARATLTKEEVLGLK